MAHTFIDFSTAICINGSGTATLGGFQTCMWLTPNGAASVLVITNVGTAQLSIAVSGAPPEVFTTDGAPLNGLHQIAPNVPTANITALADFKGQQVMVFNVSTPASTAFIAASAPQPCS